MRQGFGNWVTGEDFWGREADLELFIERIDQGANQLLVAQRRMGKTSLMREAKRRLEGRYTCVFVDLQKACDAQEAMVELSLALQPHKNLWQKTREMFSSFLGSAAKIIEGVNLQQVGLKIRSGLSAGNWVAKGDRLLAILADADPPALLLIDELPILVNRILKGDDFQITPDRRRAADQFMSWFRNAAARHQGEIRFVLCGSIGLEPILGQAGLSATINNFTPFTLGPWDECDSVGCLRALADTCGVSYEEGVPERMIELLGIGNPHHVQVFFCHAHEWALRHGQRALTLQDVETIYDTEMVCVRGHAELAHEEERLKLVHRPTIMPLVLEMLTETAVSGVLTGDAMNMLWDQHTSEGHTGESKPCDVLGSLVRDGYLRQSNGGHVWRSRLLKDWWKARHGLAHTPVLKRGD